MPTLAITLTLEDDGRPLDDEGGPWMRAVAAPEVRTFTEEHPPNTVQQPLQAPLDGGVIQALVLTTTEEVTVLLNGQIDGGIFLTRGGALVAMGVTITDVAVLNVGSATARLRGAYVGVAAA